MATFSRISKQRLSTCHTDLQAVCNELIKQYDFSVLQGYRGEQEQNAAFEKGNSKVRYPLSAHNKIPSRAVDIAPYPVDWNDTGRFRELIIRFDTVANILRGAGKIKSRFVYGGFWPTLQDWPHIEIQEN